MKKKQLLFLGIFSILLSACSKHYSSNDIIVEAESVLNEYPDSAYQLLSSMPHPEQLPMMDYAAWCLHYTHAQYKTYREIKSDSIINIAVEYYADAKLKKYKGTAYYVSGCVRELLNQKDKAIIAYKNAIAALGGTQEHNILGLATINMAYIYKQNENYALAQVLFLKSLSLFKTSGNKKYQVSNYLEISNISSQLDYPFDTTMFYSNKALNLAKEIKDTVLYYYILSRQGELLSRSNKEIALRNLLIGFNHCPPLRIKNASYLAYLYSGVHKPDSAKYYLKIANEENNNDELQVLKNLAVARVYRNLNDYKQAYSAMEVAYSKQDSVFKKKLQAQLYKIEKQFDLSEKEKENASLRLANQRNIIWIGFLIIVVLAVLIVLLQAKSIHKKKQAELYIKQQEIEFELKQQKLENQTKYELLLSKLKQRLDITLRFKKLQTGNYNPKKQEDFLNTIRNELVLAESEWQYYIEETNRLFNNRIAELQQNHAQLTANDLIVIALICLGIDISDACNLLNSSKETMYMRRKRVKKRLGIEAEIEIEVWIKNNITIELQDILEDRHYWN